MAPLDLRFRVLVCGGRDFNDYGFLVGEMNRLNHERGPFHVIIHGNARGADFMASLWAKNNKITQWPVPAEWSKYGRGAGPRRNKKMLGMSPRLVIAFPGGKGTRNMMKLARSAGVEVIEVRP